MSFDPHRAETYPALLTLDEVAAIFRTTPAAIRKRVMRNVFVAGRPCQAKPMLWRRAAVVQAVEGDVAYLAHVTQRNPKVAMRQTLRLRKAI